MRRITAASCLAAGLLVTSGPTAFAQALEQEPPLQEASERETTELASTDTQAAESDPSQIESTETEVSQSDTTYRIDQDTLPNAIDQKGPRPQADPSALPPAATTLPAETEDLKGPPSLALPDKPEQVRVRELRPLTLDQALEVVEVNSPSLKAAASRVDQAKSRLRAAISAWYPSVNLQANGFPQYFKSYRYRNPKFVRSTVDVPRNLSDEQIAFRESIGLPTEARTRQGQNEFYTRQWQVNLGIAVNWNIIDPARVPQIALARDDFEKTRDAYLIALRDLRLQTSSFYFELQSADEGVRVGQASVKASLLSLRDARARFNAGVNTLLDVLEAQTQLAEDRKLLTDYLARQDLARRRLASLLDLPQDVTPTAATPPRPLGLWEPSLQESIIAAYNYREELDQLILDISINNSRANASLAAIQPVLTFVNNWTTSRTDGQSGQRSWGAIDMDDYQWDVSNAASLQLSWNLYDGGRARAQYRQSKQAAEESAFNFASERDAIRLEVEQSFFDLRKSIQNIQTTSSRVLTSRESLRLSLLRVQAGVSTQREVINNQQDLTRAELAYTDAIRTYNTSLAELRRRTGLDALLPCGSTNRPATKSESEMSDIPIEPTPIPSACPAVISAADDGDTLPVQPLW